MWRYEITSGKMFDKNGKIVATGYSGKGQYKNRADSTSMVGEGPLPVGHYTVCEPHTSAKTGPYAMNLLPAKSNTMYGRSAFQIHGDSVKAPGTASSGCIILPRTIRELIWNSGDRELEVVA
ncbi:hypothetical protein fHeYen902_086c [Yersinia phage fHe-Yen9-02]|nr:hypothetical protein fHeYen902_086c [Yersinia phage fHe-Yen9-02]